MRRIGRFVPPAKNTLDRDGFDAAVARFDAAVARLESDSAFRKEIEAICKQAYDLVTVQQQNGANLPVDQAIREFHLEYNNREANLGPDRQPSSFNVIEAFYGLCSPIPSV